jgi:hypothetical protein
MSTINSKTTPEEIDQAKQIYKDVNDFLEYFTNIIQTQVQEFEEEDPDDELSPTVSQFLNDYKEYVSSLPQIHTQLVNSDSSSSSSSSTRERFWRYSQSLPPNLLSNLQKLEAKLDRSVRVSPLFSTSLPTLDNTNGKNEKLLLTNETSPCVTLLKAQLEKYAKEQEKNRIVIRVPKYSYDEPVEEERKVVFVVKKSTAVIVAPPTVVEPPKEQEPIKEGTEENSTIEEISEKVLSEKDVKKSIIDFDFLSKFLSITKVGFSKSQLSSLVWA